MSTMTPTVEGGGGNGTTEGGGSNMEQTSNPTTPPAQQQQHQQHPPPSPLSGCYLLVVLPEPHTAQHKDLILNRLAKGFLSWDKDSCHVDLEKELQALVAQSPEGEEARNGERLIQYATENLVTEVLIYPQSNTLLQCIRNLLASFTKHRHIIHAGYTFGGNGSWILQDGTFSLADFLDAFSEHEVQRVLRAYENSVTVDIHCIGVGDWTTSRLSKELCTRACRVRVNPDDVLTAGVPAITSFTNYIGQYLIAQTLDQLMEPSDVVGNIRFSHPTLYVFPGGEGDAALFGINGFNMLVDGGFARKACFWDFARHLDRLDAVLVTRVNNSNIGGMSSVLQKKKEMHVYPQIGHFFCNLIERRHVNSPDGNKDIDPLILNLIDVGQEMMVNLRHINLRPHHCYRDPDPINLYHKVGHGTLDMYVLSPSKDSREVREFMSKWNASDTKLFAGSHKKDTNSIIFPVQNLVSICALLVWQPANPEDTITRILFPGSTPQHKIFEGIERLRHLEFLKHTVCTAKSLSPSSSLVTLKDKAVILKPKLSSIERETKRLAEIRKEKRDNSEVKAVKKDSVIDDTIAKTSPGKPIPVPQPKIETKAKKIVENKKIESDTKEIKTIEKELKETKKETKKVESETKKTDVKVETEKTALIKENKVQKIETKRKENKDILKPTVKTNKSESTIKSSLKQIEKKPKTSGEKKDIMKSSPTTPKKTMNGISTKTDISKTVAKSTTKIAPKISAPPAKSTKDANNRMVVERKNIELSSMTSSIGSTIGAKGAPKSKPVERKSITRRTKPLSPSKARLPISPAKSTRSTPTASVKSEKDATIRKVKGETTDSSAVSTPSGIEPESVNKLTEKNLTERSEDISLDSIESKVLADLKEEREVVEEIEAVLQKAERIEEARKDERFEGDDDITAEATDKKEEDMTEEDVTAEIDDIPKKLSRKESQELTEEDEYLIVEKEEVFTEDSVQSGDTEHKHHLDELESEKSRIKKEKESDAAVYKHDQSKEFVEEKKDEVPEKKLVEPLKKRETRKSIELPPEDREILKEEMQKIIVSATEVIQKNEEKEFLGKKEIDDALKEAISLSPDKLDSSNKLGIDQKEPLLEKLEESQERISTIESGATTTAPTLPEDERIPLDNIKEDVDEKHVKNEIEEKDIPVKPKEAIPEPLPIVTKPEVKVLDVQPSTHRIIPRDVVKTPDEVADLPVHEEVDPKLYKMVEIGKDKGTKVPVPVLMQQSKDPQISPPVVKEQKDKGMFSFFGKVADKFEKGIDKLTKKNRRDSEKDSEDKSSKSSSPKETKPQEKVVLDDIEIEKMFPKLGKVDEKVESFEHIKPEVCDIKAVIINEAATFLQKEITKSTEEFLMQPKTERDLQVKTENIIQNESLKEQVKKHVTDDIEEVEAFVEEASNKFKNVKDSLQDSLESLEEKIDDKNKLSTSSNDAIKDTLTGVAEKLTDIKSDINDFIDSKEPERVKFIIPSNEDLEEEEDDTKVIIRDFKEAVREVAEVLVGTTGIEIEKEEKRKDVEEVVKKVEKVLKEDKFFTEKVPVSDEKKLINEEDSSRSVTEDTILPKKDIVSEELIPQEKIKELMEEGEFEKIPSYHKKDEELETFIEPCIDPIDIKFVTKSDIDTIADKEDIKRLCEDIMKNDTIKKPTVSIESDIRVDVMDLGLEKICIKKISNREIYDENIEEKVIVEPEINFQQNLSPGTAELVTVTPGSTPSSPKLITGLELSEPPPEYKFIFNNEMSLENIIEEFIVERKQKITMQILEYIANVKCVPKEKVINIIQEIIIKYKIPRENVTDNIQILRMGDDITSEKRLEIENYITKEFLKKNKKISLLVIEEISEKYRVSKSIVIEIVEDVMIKSKLSRESVFDISEESYFVILKTNLKETLETKKEKLDLSFDTSAENLEELQSNFEKTDKRESLLSNLEEIGEDKMVDGFVSISSADAVETFLQQERNQPQTEKKVLNDFEAVEQEYKVREIPSISSVKILNEQKVEEVEELFDDFSDVIEADEKFVKETIEKVIEDKDISETESNKFIKKSSREFEIFDLSDIDTKEKYLDEAKEKVSNIKELDKDNTQLLTSASENLDKSRSFETDVRKTETSPVESTNLKKLQDFEKPKSKSTAFNDLLDSEKTVDLPCDYENKLAMADIMLQESSRDSQEPTVKRMLVTASSEDGGHEMEICPSGTVAFSKTSSPEELLKDVDSSSITRKDSLISKYLDKDILRSDNSTPDKDSIASEELDEEEEKNSLDDSLNKPPSVSLETKTLQNDKIKVDEEIKPLEVKTESIIEKSSIVSTDITEKIPDSVYTKDASPTSVLSRSSITQISSHPVQLSYITETKIESEILPEKFIAPEKIKHEIHEEDTKDVIKHHSRSSSIENEIDILSKPIEKAKLPEKSSNTDDLRQEPTKLVECQSKVESDSLIVKKELLQDFTVSTDNIQAVDETFRASKEGSKSPSVEKEFDKNKESSEKSSVIDSNEYKIDVDNIQSDILHESKSLDSEKEIDEKQKLSDDKILIGDVKCTFDRKIVDLTEDKLLKESFENQNGIKETSLEKDISLTIAKDSPEKNVSDKLEKDIDIDATLDETIETPKAMKTVTEKIYSKDETLAKHEIIDNTEQVKIKSPTNGKEIGRKDSLSNKSISSKDVQLPTNESNIQNIEIECKLSSIEKKVVAKDPSEESALTAPKILTEDNIIEDMKFNKGEKRVLDNVKEDKLLDQHESLGSEEELGNKEVSMKKISESLSNGTIVKEITIAESQIIDNIDNISSLSSVEKEKLIRETLPEKSTLAEDNELSDEIIIKDSHVTSKSPSSEKEISYKDVPSCKKLSDIDDIKCENELFSSHAEDKSKSPSIERDLTKIKMTSEDILSKDELQIRDETITIRIDDSSKLRNVENKQSEGDASSEKSRLEEDITGPVDEIVVDNIDTRLKSSSLDKEIHYDDASSEKPTEIDNLYLENYKSSICQMTESESPNREKYINVQEVSSVQSHTSDDRVKLNDKVIDKTDGTSTFINESDKREVLCIDSSINKDMNQQADDLFISKPSDQSKSSIAEKAVVIEEEIPKKATTMINEKHESEKIATDQIKVNVDKNEDSHRKLYTFEREQTETDKKISEENKLQTSSLEKEINKDASSDELFLSTDLKHEEDKYNLGDKLIDKSKSFISESGKEDILVDKSTNIISDTIRGSKEDTSALLYLDKDKVKEEDDKLNLTKFETNIKILSSTSSLSEKKNILEDNIESESKDIVDLKKDHTYYDVEAPAHDIQELSLESDVKSEIFSKSFSAEKLDDISAQFSDSKTDMRKLSTASSKFDEPSADRPKSDSIVINKYDISDSLQSPSLVQEKLDFESIDDYILKEQQIGKSKEKSPTDSRSSSISENKLPIEEKFEKSISQHIESSQVIEKQDLNKLSSDSPVKDKTKTDTLLQESINERKASVTSIDSNTDSKGKDRSRSHSLFETGDKTPLLRSRAASLYEDKLMEKLDILEHAKDSTDVTFQENDELKLSQETLHDLQKISDTDKNLKILKSISPSSEQETLIISESDRPEPYIDEEISISENKRIEIETLLMDDYIRRGIKITEPIFEQIVIKTSLPKYIINEIIEEIGIKKQVSRDMIADESIFHEDDYDDTQLKSDSERKTTPEVSERKSSGYSTPDSHRYEDKEKNVSYTDFESPFHKAFVGGMTEIRTTHITTLSGKSTPDIGPRDETPDSIPEITSAKITTIKNVPEELEESADDKFTHSQLESSKFTPNIDNETEKLLKSDDESQDQSHKNISVVVSKTTEVTKYLDESIDIPEECVRSKSISEKILPEKDASEKEILETKEAIKQEESQTVYEEVKHEIFKEIGIPSSTKEESIHDDEINQKNIEIITTTTTKTIITKKELDSVSRINTLSTDNISVDNNISSDVQEDKPTEESTTTSKTNIQEKLISLESKGSDQSSTLILNTSNKDIKNVLESDNTIIYTTKSEQTSFNNKDLMDHTVPEQLEQATCPLIQDLISEKISFSEKLSKDISLPKESSDQDSFSKSTTDTSISPLIRDSSIIQPHFSDRSTPERKSDGRSRTATPEGFRSGDVIRTIVTTTRTMSDDGEIITTTQEVTEATNEKGETILLNTKTDVKVDERLPESFINDVKPIDTQRTSSISSDTVNPMSFQINLNSGDSNLETQVLSSSVEQDLYTDKEQSGSSILPASHQTHLLESDKEELIKISDEFTSASKSSSFYPEMPPESIQFSHSTVETTEFVPEQGEFSLKKFTVEKEYTGGYKEKDSKKYVDEADLDFEKALRGTANEKELEKNYQQSSILVTSSSTGENSTSVQNKDSASENKKDPLAEWGSPLGLPSPKAPRKFNLRSPIQACSSADLSPDSLNFDVINDWGEPMKLPSPALATNEISNKTSPGTPTKKDKKQTKKVISENIKNKKFSESPTKIEKKIKETKNKVQPVYVDLTYVSHHGNSFYTALEFFKKVRARYYVFSGTEPSREVYDALLEAKKSWEEKDLEVTMIPTYDTDTLGYWVADNEEALAAYHIDLSPSASRCTINLQDHETSCSAYRLEF